MDEYYIGENEYQARLARMQPKEVQHLTALEHVAGMLFGIINPDKMFTLVGMERVRAILAENPSEAVIEAAKNKILYLTECSGCCGKGNTSSYRLFSAIPEFDQPFALSGLREEALCHPDTRNPSMICKVYNQQRGRAMQSAQWIAHYDRENSISVEDISGKEGTPIQSKIIRLRKLKGDTK